MRRELKHYTALNKIIKDERLSPHRRLLCELFAIWLDCDSEEYKERIFKVIEAQYGSSSRVKWDDKDTPITNIEQGASQLLKDYFSKIEEEVKELQNEVSTEVVQFTSNEQAG